MNNRAFTPSPHGLLVYRLERSNFPKVGFSYRDPDCLCEALMFCMHKRIRAFSLRAQVEGIKMGMEIEDWRSCSF